MTLNSKIFEGLKLVKISINNTLSSDDTEVCLKLFMLLFADDTVILAENSHELQKSVECNVRILFKS